MNAGTIAIASAVEEAKRGYIADGVCIVRGAIPLEQVAALKISLEEIFARNEDSQRTVGGRTDMTKVGPGRYCCCPLFCALRFKHHRRCWHHLLLPTRRQAHTHMQTHTLAHLHLHTNTYTCTITLLSLHATGFVFVRVLSGRQAAPCYELVSVPAGPSMRDIQQTQ